LGSWGIDDWSFHISSQNLDWSYFFTKSGSGTYLETGGSNPLILSSLTQRHLELNLTYTCWRDLLLPEYVQHVRIFVVWLLHNLGFL
jgi:hypothetical protein